MFYNCITYVIMYLEHYLTVFFVYLQNFKIDLHDIYLTFINYFKVIEKNNCKYSHKLEYL